VQRRATVATAEQRAGRASVEVKVLDMGPSWLAQVEGAVRLRQSGASGPRRGRSGGAEIDVEGRRGCRDRRGCAIPVARSSTKRGHASRVPVAASELMEGGGGRAGRLWDGMMGTEKTGSGTKLGEMKTLTRVGSVLT
jgi:hypothetical protein